ncbi:MAG: serine/threonine protein kinase [Nitrososphaerota archaeon]|nr:serine/threonine protein kinase [Candidatus Bathyarchaeota archaeon]MDW8023860.1 serine/threonine protein kinase [Nitrososphaerota archaeon]
MGVKVSRLTVSVEGLWEEPFASILCYPKPSEAEIGKRVAELKRLGVTALEFSGEKHAFNVPVLGKGCVGIVVKAYRGNKKAALKIRRVDANRAGMQREAQMLKAANSVYVGPKLLDFSNDFLLMQFIEGDLFSKWLEREIGKKRLERVLRDVLEQCWRLDGVGLDHGELSRAPKHVIVDGEDKPFILDFETASLNRKTSNVTSLAQFLFISGTVAEKITKILGEKDKKALLEALRAYKRNLNRQNFEKILKVCGF